MNNSVFITIKIIICNLNLTLTPLVTLYSGSEPSWIHHNPTPCSPHYHPSVGIGWNIEIVLSLWLELWHLAPIQSIPGSGWAIYIHVHTELNPSKYITSSRLEFYRFRVFGVKELLFKISIIIYTHKNSSAHKKTNCHPKLFSHACYKNTLIEKETHLSIVLRTCTYMCIQLCMVEISLTTFIF